jgi:hypothetical protein
MMEGPTYRKHLFNRLVECNVPDHLFEGLIEYLADRRPMGSFLTAIVSNDLMEACVRADPVNRYHICDVVLFLVNYAPADCWGSEKNVADWLAARSVPVPEVFE